MIKFIDNIPAQNENAIFDRTENGNTVSISLNKSEQYWTSQVKHVKSAAKVIKCLNLAKSYKLWHSKPQNVRIYWAQQQQTNLLALERKTERDSFESQIWKMKIYWTWTLFARRFWCFDRLFLVSNVMQTSNYTTVYAIKQWDYGIF